MRRLTRGAKSRPLLALAVAGLFWLLVFAAFLRFGEGGLTLFYEFPPEATDYRFTFQPEGIVRVTDSHISADGVDYIFCRKIVTIGDLCFTCPTSAQASAFLQKPHTCRSVDCTVNTAPAKKT